MSIELYDGINPVIPKCEFSFNRLNKVCTLLLISGFISSLNLTETKQSLVDSIVGLSVFIGTYAAL